MTDQPLDEIDCLRNDEPKCPHCGEDLGDAWELGLDDGGEAEVECPACEKPYQVECSVTVKYSTSPTGGWPDSTA